MEIVYFLHLLLHWTPSIFEFCFTSIYGMEISSIPVVSRILSWKNFFSTSSSILTSRLLHLAPQNYSTILFKTSSITTWKEKKKTNKHLFSTLLIRLGFYTSLNFEPMAASCQECNVFTYSAFHSSSRKLFITITTGGGVVSLSFSLNLYISKYICIICKVF